MRWGRTERGYASALASVIIWSLVPVGIRFFVMRIDPYLFNVIRFSAAGCAAIPLCAYVKPWRWPARDLWLLLACAALSVPGYNVPVALGARVVPAGALGVLIATEPIMIVALTLLIQRRSIRLHVIGGSLIALIGVGVTSGIWNSTQNVTWTSTLQVLAGAFSWSCYTVLAGSLNRRYGSLGVTGIIVVVGSVILLAISAPMIDAHLLPDRTTTLMLAAMGIISSVLAFLFWNIAGAHVPAERLGLFLYLIPLVSIGAGMQFLSEPCSLPMLLGGVLVVAGVWTASRRDPALAIPSE